MNNHNHLDFVFINSDYFDLDYINVKPPICFQKERTDTGIQRQLYQELSHIRRA